MDIKKILLLFYTLLFVVSNAWSINQDTAKCDCRALSLGLEFILPNISGNIANENLRVNDNDRRFVLLDYSTMHSFGTVFSFEKHNKGNKRFSFIPEFGIYHIKGTIRSRAYSASNSAANKIVENNFDYQFNNLFVHFSYGLKYLLVKDMGIEIIVATKTAFQFHSKSVGTLTKVTIDNNQNPIGIEEGNSFTGDRVNQFLQLQLYLKYGIRKQFALAKRHFLVLALEQDLSILKMHYPMNLRSNAIILSMRYGFLFKA